VSGRDAILGRIRNALKADPDDASRAQRVQGRIRKAAVGVIPARAQVPPRERLALFLQKAEGLAATVQRVKTPDDVPRAIASYLRSRNLPAALRMGADERLAAMPWDSQKALTISHGASDGDDLVGVSHADSGVAETGTIVLLSGPANPTTVNFLPDHHVVVLDAADVVGDLETALTKVRKRFGKGKMPRAVNLVSGPSRSGDIEQKLVLGAHGPRALHILVVGQP